MVARLLRATLALLITLSLVWLWWWLARGRVWVAVVGAVLLLLLHVPLLAIEFVLMHHTNRSDPAPRARLGEVVSAWWNEARLGLSIFAWWQPFRARVHADHVPAAQGQRGLVLVHGFMCNRGFWNGWMPRLRARGIAFVAIDLEPPFGTCDGYASAIDTAVQLLRTATGLAPVVVAHSMGGLAVRGWLRWAAQQPPAERATRDVHAVITLGSPHQGTMVGAHWPLANVREMQRESPWLTALSGSEAVPLRQRFICYYSHCDNIVFPASTATLAGADNRHLRGVAHVQMVEHPQVFQAALASIGVQG